MTRVRTLLIVAGVAGLVHAVLGLLTDPDIRLAGVLIFLAVVLVAHDALWMPALLAVTTLVARMRNRKTPESTPGPGNG
ncbi:hypothetical protein [Actinoplanes sp. NBRC 103695]|uniref:hypothetical protein n=1 Tax=Actinoplanes sp. NBRC 103695 TaxID=3032202 RepID=UPI0024A0D983|nr:hypothetical protein [Actinoplanes sp. NBRC 103695]GLY99446.1 hypothetical protein Acsp02_66990 [Actinoplanes sp. NBRC 103695]